MAAIPDELKRLAGEIAGSVVTPSHPLYDESRKLWNAMIDKRPYAIVRCKEPADVVAAVNFARRNTLKVAIRGGGHSIAGHSVCDKGILVHLGDMNRVTVDPEKRTARVQGGALLGDLDKATQEFGLATPAGVVSHTGVAGLTLGGGLGHLMRKFGLTVDHLLSAEIVLADGRTVRADAKNHPDLFWALRGGSGNFGVVTEFEFRAFPIHPPYVGIAIHPLSEAAPVLSRQRDVMGDNPSNDLQWYSYMRLASGLPGIPEHLLDKPSLLTIIEWHGEPTQAQKIVGDYLDQIGGFHFLRRTVPFLELQRFSDEIAAHGNHAWTKAGFFTEISDELVDAMIEVAERVPSWRSVLEVVPMGGAIDQFALDGTAFPHRAARYVTNIIAMWEHAADNDRNIAWVRDSYAKLERFMSGGAYVNYMSGEETGGVAAAYGVGLQARRLRKIKAEVDPNNMFCFNFNLSTQISLATEVEALDK